jgi:hypothetical protein
MDTCRVCIGSIEEDNGNVFAHFVDTDFANEESSAASHQIYENPCCQYLTIVAYVENVNVVIVIVIVIVVVVIAVIIAVFKEVAVALAS